MLAGILSKLGVDMGPDTLMNNKPDKVNPRGYFEDLQFMDLNERILTLSERGWRDIPMPVKLSNACMSFRGPAHELVQKRMVQNGDSWGWKDPRMCLTFPAYFGALDQNHTLVIKMERSKVGVMKSLLHREAKSGLSANQADRLVDAYLAYAHVNASHFRQVASFQFSDLIHNPIVSVKALADLLHRLGHELPDGSIPIATQHIDPELNHHGI